MAEVAKRYGVSEPSICAWRKKFGGMGTDDVRRLKALEQARYVIGRGVTQRRTCTLMNVARSGLVYECKMPVKRG